MGEEKKKCPKCGQDMVEENPFAGFPIEHLVRAYVCTGCRYVELYAK
jgi:predicted nucleic-acid-binding Zn-ribbon protein